MKYKAVNEIENFSFQDAQIEKIEKAQDGIIFTLEAVIVRAKNSQNANYTDSYAGTLKMHLIGGNIQKAVKEGYKYYDANDVLVEEVPDSPLTNDDTQKLLSQSKGYYLFDMVKVNDEENVTGHFLYLLGIDADEDTSYWLQIEFDEAVLEWDKYLNRVQKM